MPDEDVRPESLSAARVAVAALFFVNGALFANWVPRVPDVKVTLGLGEGALGLAIFGGAIGGLVGSLAAGPLDTRFGSREVSVFGGVVLAALLAGPGLAWSWATLAAALLLVAGSDAVMDVSMNAHAVAVQRGYGRSIVNGFHALWSLGAVAGSLAGSAAAARGVPVATHLAFAGLVLGSAVVVARHWLLPTVTVQAPPSAARGAGGAIRWIDRARRRGLVLPTGAVGALGLMALLGGIVEDTPGSWSAVYLRETLGASPGVAGLAFAACTGAMTVGRLLGDRTVERFGAARVLRTGALIAAVGLAAALVLATPVAAIVGFGLLGIGVSTLFPLVFATAGGLADTPAGGAIGMVSLLARGGFLLAPPLIGAVADAVGLQVALALVVAACAAVAASAGVVTRRAARSG
jgi:fucose permease